MLHLLTGPRDPHIDILTLIPSVPNCSQARVSLHITKYASAPGQEILNAHLNSLHIT